MTFENRFNNSMHDIDTWTQIPPVSGTSAVKPGVDVEAREAVVALQAQVDALYRGITSLHGWLISPDGGKMKDSQLDQLLTAAADLRAPEFPRAVLIEAGLLEGSALPAKEPPRTHKETSDEEAEEEDLEDEDDAPRPSSRKKVVAHQATGSGRKERKPKVDQPATLTEWFRRLNETLGVSLRHYQALYRQIRFEQPKVILLPTSDAEHQKIIDWMHSKVLDYAIQYGTEEGTEQHWISIPAAALAQLGLAVPDGGESLCAG